MAYRKRMSKRGSRKNFRRGAKRVNKKNFRGGASQRGGIKL